MNFKHIKFHISILAIAVLLCSAFIFGNAFKDFEKSHKTSSKIADAIAPDKENMNQAVGSMVNLGGSISAVVDGNENPEDISVDFAIRLFAHLLEYAALGVAVMGLVLAVKMEWGKGFFGWAFFYVLAVAVADEYIQGFSDRSSSIGDVLLDFAGALIGFATVLSVFYTVLWIKRRKQDRLILDEIESND